MRASNSKPPASFESALQELESIVQTLEGGGAPLEESLKAYERGTGLLNFCQATLSQAEQKIRILDNNGTIRDFGDVGDLGEIPPPNSAGESS